MDSYLRKTRTKLQMKQETLSQLSGVPKTIIQDIEEGNSGKYSQEVFEALARSMNVDVSVIADWKTPEKEAISEIKDNHLFSNTNGIKRALRKNVELLAKELVDQSGMTDADIFKTANAIFEYAELLLRVNSIDKSLQEEEN